ncbi:MAG: Gfo/Idh/MocA family oxidoreductase [Tannerellaceae bacterium]|jgi:predicted dehydrogenase|nr:Gfo/Idh/MocA family oxidoreductase [Tannerellaceae bacterium]
MKENTNNSNQFDLSRRNFIGTMAAAAGFMIVPRHVMGGVGYTAPSDMVNLAGIGVGSQGGGDIQNIATPDVPIKRVMNMQGYLMQPYAGIRPQRQGFPGGGRPQGGGQGAAGAVANSDSPMQMGDAGSGSFKHANIYAICDVDHDYAGHILAGYPKAKKYHDFREMIDKEKEIDAVLIGTPDHTHAVIASYAMNAGKHVFVEKPMAKTIHEVRFLSNLAASKGLVTQMGNQGHNIEGTMQTIEWIRAGVIGNVREVHMWSNRPMWRQGYFPRPEEKPVPSNLKYDLWLGPAPQKPYNPEMLHFAWRGLWDYGTGAMGDMGAHTFDAPILALDLGLPTKIQATTTPFNDVYLPQSEYVEYDFAARGSMPPVKVTWSDGGIKPLRPDGLESGRSLRECLYIGDKGMIMHGTHGALPELVPNDPGFTPPAATLPRPKSIYVDFIEAIKEGRKANNDFAVASKLTEIMLLTNIAVVSQQINSTLEYDAASMKITNLPEANDYFHYEYRNGWKL